MEESAVRREGSSPGRAHFVGIAGSGMKGLAELLVARGWTVTGSDAALPTENAGLNRLRDAGVVLYDGHAADQIPNSVDVVVFSAAVPVTNVERQRARELGVPECSYSQMLGRLTAESRALCIAGTHGKSTTTALAGWILEQLEERPSVVVGAEYRHTGRNGWAGEGPWLVAESCEFQKNFLDLSPQVAAILSIEPDHFDCFATPRELRDAFASFAALTPAHGTLVLPAANAVVQETTQSSRARRVTFGHRESGADWWWEPLPFPGEQLQSGDRPRTGERWEWGYRERSLGPLYSPLFGAHNTTNVMAAIAIVLSALEDHGRAVLVGTIPGRIAEAVETFPGLKRRFEVVYDGPAGTLIDDYAHHPTEIEAVLSGARRAYPGRPITLAFQAHQISRTRALLDEFAQALSRADRVVITPVFAAREAGGDACREWGEKLAERTARLGTIAEFVPSLDHVPPTMDHSGSAPGLWMTVGAGDIHRTHHALARRLQRHHDAE